MVQDYHFALLPRMIKEKRPDARVAIFWHIPWPNPEAFGICPWQRELLDGLLGADLIGFHVQAHCNNFLQTVDRTLESQIDWEHFTVKRNEHITMVRPFPISVDFAEFKSSAACRCQRIGKLCLAQGTWRRRPSSWEWAWTGWITPRASSSASWRSSVCSSGYPAYLKQFVFVQIGAPSRTHIKRYHDLLEEVEAEAERINRRFQTANWKPIIFLKRQHSHREIDRYYRAADLCLVTSLHDGMNLVAKEFLAARDDEDGVLVLSCFTGAARELRDALLVNPYDIDQTAEAIRLALEMDPEEKKQRMQRMRKLIREQNIYRWAGDLIGQLCDVRVAAPGKTPERRGDWHFGGLMRFPIQLQEEHLVDTLSKLDVQDFFRDVAQAGQSALLLDYDGTLAPFRQNRHEAFPYPGVTAPAERKSWPPAALGWFLSPAGAPRSSSHCWTFSPIRRFGERMDWSGLHSDGSLRDAVHGLVHP